MAEFDQRRYRGFFLIWTTRKGTVVSRHGLQADALSTPSTPQGAHRPLANGARTDSKLSDSPPRLPPPGVQPRHLQRPLELSHPLPPRMQQPRGSAHGGYCRKSRQAWSGIQLWLTLPRSQEYALRSANIPSYDITDPEVLRTRPASYAHTLRVSCKTSSICTPSTTKISLPNPTGPAVHSSSPTGPWISWLPSFTSLHIRQWPWTCCPYKTTTR